MASLSILCPAYRGQRKRLAWGKHWSNLPTVARGVFETANRVLGFDLMSICFAGPEERLNQTDISQPAIYVVSVASFRDAVERGMFDPGRTKWLGVCRLEPGRIYRPAPGRSLRF